MIEFQIWVFFVVRGNNGNRELWVRHFLGNGARKTFSHFKKENTAKDRFGPVGMRFHLNVMINYGSVIVTASPPPPQWIWNPKEEFASYASHWFGVDVLQGKAIMLMSFLAIQHGTEPEWWQTSSYNTTMCAHFASAWNFFKSKNYRYQRQHRHGRHIYTNAPCHNAAYQHSLPHTLKMGENWWKRAVEVDLSFRVSLRDSK